MFATNPTVRRSRASRKRHDSPKAHNGWIANCITIYRPARLMSVSMEGVPHYELGELRAKVFGVRVPILWALDKLRMAGIGTWVK